MFKRKTRKTKKAETAVVDVEKVIEVMKEEGVPVLSRPDKPGPGTRRYDRSLSPQRRLQARPAGQNWNGREEED